MVKRWVISVLFLFFIYFVIIIHWSTYINGIDLFKSTPTSLSRTPTTFRGEQTQFTLNCFNGNMTATCPNDNLPTFQQDQYSSAASTCPVHFKWIHEDLKPWKRTGITREMLERGKNKAHFRLVIKQGKAYLEKYENSYQTRDVFIIWGILQLLRLYPGNIPDLELLFNTNDKPVVEKQLFKGPMSPPPMFHFCGKQSAFDIIFPDWSFWGWAETGIRPWETTLHNIQENNKKIKWKDRIPYAYWKGSTHVSWTRYYLRKCNTTDQHDWNARIYTVHWDKEIAQGFQNSKLEDQCTHRYKIYVEGQAWSVSEKYILACDSMTLFVVPEYYDFYTRSLIPWEHVWPVSTKSTCQNIKDVVDWGNTHPDKAEEIGKSGARFIEENLKMKFVYDYMFHALTEYARLLRFEPTIPAGAVEICSETWACPMSGLWREFMIESMVKSPSDTPPCTRSFHYDEDKEDEK